MSDHPSKRPSTKHRVVRCVAYVLLAVFAALWLSGALMPRGIREADRAECEQMLGQFKQHVRETYLASGKLPGKLTTDPATATTDRPRGDGCGVNPAELRGGFYEILDRVYALPDGRAMLIAQPKNSEKPWCAHVFEWRGASGEFIWDEFDSEDEALKYFGIR